ncbi:uncharacterized protein LOC111384861 isoform X2 [Olea europaea var. sylvestris]|uniref:uncharacterized protein LOC111384861 isoform X2 n=1 Tax=Olea europaea var. sylvestris TaxID=158386 RepID=UPI000C1D2F3B|nr:uncharacterized protein LOC111384861 isoform X2 [Olea europaea var. sylvestris]
MEEKQEIPVGGGVVSGVAEYWWWATASTGQLTWAVSIYRKGYAGDCRLMPFKAFAVASLFIGATATAAVASLRASGRRHEACWYKYKEPTRNTSKTMR